MKVFRFRELDIYKDVRKFISIIYKITSKFPKSEIYGLTQQLRRASVSINLNIAEANGYQSKEAQQRFYYIAKGSLYECIAIFEVCLDMQFINNETYEELKAMAERILARLNGLIKYASHL